MSTDTQTRRVICLSGPTAAGKTALAMALADRLPVQLISVDSALIYRGMDIGTAKPTPAELSAYPHRLIDICDPAEVYSAADFAKDARLAIDDAFTNGKIPLLVGGTMMYLRSLLVGMASLPAADPDIRAELEQQAETQGWQCLHAELANHDPASAARIHPNDPQRLLRALEVYRITGKTLTSIQASEQSGLPYETYQLAVAPTERAVLHERIAQRFDAMLAADFCKEVESLRSRGDLHLDLPSMRSVGYRQMWQHLDGQLSWAEMRERGIIASRQLAKRQLTWLRSWPVLHWLDPAQPDLLDQAMNLLNSEPVPVTVWQRG